MNFISKIKDKIKTNKKEKSKIKEVKKEHDIFIERPQINIFIKLAYIFMKNIKLLIRSKTSALIFFFGPLLIVFLVALAFNTSTLYDLNIAVHSDSYSELSESVISSLSDSQYNVIKLESFDDCIDAVKFSDFHVCLVFPADMAVDNTVENIIQIYVDNSRLNIANLISSQVGTKVSIEASALSEELVTTILTTLDTTNTKVAESDNTLNKLISSNKDQKSFSSSLSSDLEDIDFSYSTYSTSEIDEEISDIKDSQNLSSSVFNSLNSLIDDFESSYNTLENTIESANSDLTSVSSSISSLDSDLSSDTTNLESIDSNLETISLSIEEITITSVESIVSPIKTSIEPISFTNSYLFYILPSLLVLLVMFVTLLMSATNIIGEKTSRAYFRNFITPTNELYFMVGEYLSNIFVLFLQTMIMMGVLFYFFNDLGWHLFAITGLSLLIIGTFFILLGMLIGYMFNSKEGVVLGTVSVALILLFFSNTIIPLETLSSYTRELLQYNPFIIGETILRNILLFNTGLSTVQNQIYILLGLSILIFIAAYIAQKFSKHYLSNA